ncbi:MAG TPA: pyridoxal-dependent decarboxylase [Candidatus Angelobacter sp.]|nr:pyridoxal-dependent decarboxylase [Candidatus Angelobacter sp.]
MLKPTGPKHSTAATDEQSSWNEYVEDFRQAGHEAVEWVAEYLANPGRHPVVAPAKPGDLIDSLPRSAPVEGESFQAILQDFDRVIMPAVTQWNHPRFFAYFACTGSTPAILGDMLAAALNTNGLHWKTSPAIAELELVALDWLRQWMGMGDGWLGIAYETASESNMHAIAAAREFVAPEMRVNGSQPNLVLYTSEQSHSSVEKGAITLGLGQGNVRRVPADDHFRMRPDALARMVQQDLAAGKRPCGIVATVGTTSTASIDPVPEIADVAEKHGLWLHIDAAYAGAAAILPECRHIMNGVERAHSFVVNTHKWLLTPIGLSAFYTRRPDILRQAFSIEPPGYLHTYKDPRAHDLMDYGVALGHRFRALKLWFVMRYFGLERFQAVLRSHIQWAQQFAALVESNSNFERVAPVSLSVVCFRYKGTDEQNRAILEKINSTGRVFLISTVLHGKLVLRLTVGNLATTWEDVQEAWELIQQAAANLDSDHKGI